MTTLWKEPAAVPADVEAVQGLVLDFEAGDPAPDGDSGALLWAAVLVCILCIVVSCGLALIVVQACRHWRGSLELVLIASIIAGCWPKQRYGR